MRTVHSTYVAAAAQVARHAVEQVGAADEAQQQRLLCGGLLLRGRAPRHWDCRPLCMRIVERKQQMWCTNKLAQAALGCSQSVRERGIAMPFAVKPSSLPFLPANLPEPLPVHSRLSLPLLSYLQYTLL